MSTVDPEWTVLTWNVQGTKPTDIARLAEVIRRDAPDVVVLQEVRLPQARELAAELGMQQVWTFKHHALAPLLPDRAEGAAILTPHTLSRAGDQVVSTARWKRTYRRRIVQWALVSRSDATAYRVINAHLSPHDRLADRLDEADRIAAIAGGLGDSPPVVVAGDLNNDGEPAVTDRLPGIEHVAAPPTSPSSSPKQRLDHVLLPVEAYRVSVSAPAGGDDWAALSDHLPVTVRFTLDWVRGDFG